MKVETKTQNLKKFYVRRPCNTNQPECKDHSSDFPNAAVAQWAPCAAHCMVDGIGYSAVDCTAERSAECIAYNPVVPAKTHRFVEYQSQVGAAAEALG